MLELKNLRAGYEGSEKLHGICATLEQGKLTAIIGPNGCGKTSLLKCAAGLLKPMGGEICLSGKNLHRMPERERARRIAYMPQSRVTPDIRVRQLAAHGRYPHLKWGQNLRAQDWEIVDAALERVALKPHAQTNVGSLSGGERQRAYIAMMLSQEAPLMLLDEPTAALDLSGQFALMALLKTLCTEGRSVVAVLHDLNLALESADAILLMRGGELLAVGSPEEIAASGEIQRTFHVDLRRTEDGKYLFYPWNAPEEAALKKI